jgi:hypothetical protein
MLVAEVLRAGAYISRFSRRACKVCTTSEMYCGSILHLKLLCSDKMQLLTSTEVAGCTLLNKLQ